MSMLKRYGAIVAAVVMCAGMVRGDGRVLVKPPEQAKIAEAMVTVKEVFGEEIKKAKTIEEKLTLAAKLLDEGLKEKDANAKWVMLTMVRDTAAENGVLTIAGAAIDGLAETFEIDALKMKSAAATTAAASKAIRTGGASDGFRVLGDWISIATNSERFEIADEMAQSGAALARISGDMLLSREAAMRAAGVKQALQMYSVAKLAAATLADKPDDPESNLALGKYLVFVKGDWDKGLPMLAKGPDNALKTAAKKDAAGSPDADGDVAIADLWWDMALGAATGPAKLAYANRAIKWYTNGMPGLTGLTKTKAEKRLKELEDMASRLASGSMREIINKMQGADKDAQGILFLTRGGQRMTSTESFKPPIAFKIVAQNEQTNIRVNYAADQIIFNWEVQPTQLRIDGGPAAGSHKLGAGDIPINKWVTIDLIVTKDRMIIKTDGKERQNVKADFSKVDMPFAIFCMGSKIAVKSIKVGAP